MPSRGLRTSAARLRGDADQEALRQALLVPWSRLQEAAERYVERHLFLLWVRAITETVDEIPETVRSALERRYPDFLRSRPAPDTRALERWIAAHEFGDASAGGWFAAVRHYACSDLRTEQAWTYWERTIAEWSRHRPTSWPTLDEWTAAVAATGTVSQAGAAEARAVEGLGRVELSRFRGVVSDLLDSRACAIWADCVSRPGHHLTELVTNDLRRRYLEIASASGPAPTWGRPIFLRLVRLGDAHWRKIAREEGWISALRYQVRHHPRYHRLIHYGERCRDLWSESPPMSYPSFAEWLAAADAYVVHPPS